MQVQTIYALSTLYGKSGVAIIRISGPDAQVVAKRLGIDEKLKPRYAYFKTIKHPENNEILDHALILYFEAPASFTGEDILELQIHGGRAVINSVLDALSIISEIRIAEAGEFSKRAFLNGKMDLTQAEGLADLIDAETKMQQQQAIKQISGKLGNLYEGWRHQIIRILALIEAYIDFPDEDIPDEVVEEVQLNVLELKQNIEKHLNDSNKGEKLRNGIQVAITGKPNVGKSSLLNHLAKREVAIVSDIPGTTRDILEVYLDIGGYPFILYDTAGIREANDKIEQMGIARAQQKIEEADLVIKLYDVDEEKIAEPAEKEIIVINKIDQLVDFSASNNVLYISVKENIGIDQLIEMIKNFAKNFEQNDEEIYITRSRYREHCYNALQQLSKFNLEKPIELAAEDLRIAAFEIGRITGKIDVEELLGVIFSSFCIGK